MITFRLLLLCLVMQAIPLFAKTDSSKTNRAMQIAVNANKDLFIFFYKEKDEKTKYMRRIFNEAMQSIGMKAVSTHINLTDDSEKTIIKKFGLSSYPMPFVLVLAPNGAVMGGFHSSIKKQQLIDSLSTPLSASFLKALQDNKLVFLCLQNSTTTDNLGALEGVNDFKANSQYANSTEIFIADPSNTNEQKFLKKLSIDANPTQALTMLIAPPKEIVGIYKGATSKDKFLEDLLSAHDEN